MAHCHCVLLGTDKENGEEKKEDGTFSWMNIPFVSSYLSITTICSVSLTKNDYIYNVRAINM